MTALPPDPDSADGRISGRPPHLRVGQMALVASGGAVGTLIRYLLQQTAPPTAFPIVTMVINIIGAFLLGLLISSLARRGPDTGRRRSLRFLLGTGALGGFTTYSTLALDSVSLAGSADASTTAIYAFGTLIIGVAVAALGVRLGSAGRAFRTGGR